MSEPTRKIDWRSLVNQAEPPPSKQPVVYDFGEDPKAKKRDTGPHGAFYN